MNLTAAAIAGVEPGVDLVRSGAGTTATGLAARTAWMGVCALVLLAPFEGSQPLLRLPGQSLSSVEAVLLAVFAACAASAAWTRSYPQWRTPLTLPWLVMLGAMVLAAAAAPVERTNALHMVGRLGLAFGVYLVTVSGATTLARVRGVLVAAAAVGALVGAIVVLDFLGLGAVRQALTSFRSGIAVVGAQVRASGPFQYPTIASMYLEIVFAMSLALLPMAIDAGRRAAIVAAVIVLAIVAEAITLTFTRAGLITMASSVAVVAWYRYRSSGFDRGVKAIAGVALLVVLQFFGSRSFESVRLRLTTEGQQAWYRMQVDAPLELALQTGATTTVPVTLTNTGRTTWEPAGDLPFRLSYHWLLPDEDRVLSWEGLRTEFPAPVPPGETVSLRVAVQAPGRPGQFRLLWDLVQEHRLWLSTEPNAPLYMSHATVSGPATRALGPTYALPFQRSATRPGRFVLWRAGARMAAAHPVTGVGPDNFRLLYGQYAGLSNADPRVHSNNMYLEMLVGGGVLGGLAFLWLCWGTASRVVATAVRPLDSHTSMVVAGVAAAMAAIALHGVVDSFLSFTATYVFFSITLGLAVACDALSRPDAHRV